MPTCIENLVGFKQSDDARPGRVRKEIQEWGQVLGADTLGGERRVAEVVLVRCGRSQEVIVG